jgi:hypothetical protein
MKSIFVSEIKNESYVRWQGRTIEQMGYAVNTLLIMTMASVGFCITQLLKPDIACCASCYIKRGVFVLLICIFLIVLLILNRLIDFRETAQIARKREKADFNGIAGKRLCVKQMGKITWYLLYAVVFLFTVGHVFIAIGLFSMI